MNFRLSKLDFARSGVLLLAGLILLATSCVQPLDVGRKPLVTIDASALIGNLQARDLGSVLSLRLNITDPSGGVIIDKTWYEAPTNGDLSFELERGTAYEVRLDIENLESGATTATTWTYRKTITLPANGDLALDIFFPSQTDWIAFLPVMAEVNLLTGGSGLVAGPLQAAYADAVASAATGNQGSLADGSFSWAWTKSGSGTIVTVTALKDLPLGSTGYSLLKGSVQSFPILASGTGHASWQFAGGAIYGLESDYSGQVAVGQVPSMTKLSVNDFDFSSRMASAGVGPVPALVPVPAAPVGVIAASGQQQAAVSWAAVNGASGYNLYWSTSPGVSPGTGTKVANVTSPHTLTGLTSGAVVYAVITAINAIGESAASSQATALPYDATLSALTLGNVNVVSKIWGPGSNGFTLPGGLNYSTQVGVGWAQQYAGKFVTSFCLMGALAPDYFLSTSGTIGVTVTPPANAVVEIWDLETASAVFTNLTVPGPGQPLTFTAQPNHRYGGFAWYTDNSQANLAISAAFN